MRKIYYFMRKIIFVWEKPLFIEMGYKPGKKGLQKSVKFLKVFLTTRLFP